MNNIVDYFGAEPLIVARLKERMAPEVRADHVYTPFSVGDMMEVSQGERSVHVIYSGDVLVDSAGNTSAQMVGQRWLVILAMRNAGSQLQNTHKIRSDAGVLIPRLLDTLKGWAPVEWMRPLSRVSGPAAGYSSTFAYFPFMFEGRIVT